MTACLCPMCTDTPAYTYTEAWRALTEARYVARLPDHVARAVYLSMVGKERGVEAETALRKAAWGLMQKSVQQLELAL